MTFAYADAHRPVRAVAFLQNAWSPAYAGRMWPRDSWLRALARSRSGQRLRVLESHCGAVSLWYDNTTPEVGNRADSVLPPDYQHILAVIGAQRPDLIVALGKQAGTALRSFCAQIPLLILPHPAHRLLTDQLYQQAGCLLADGFDGLIELRQLRGKVELTRPTPLPASSPRRLRGGAREGGGKC